jgi:hydroxymethylglutaryl-CoA synthase
MAPVSLARAAGTVATFTVDRLAFSPAPPLVSAVVDFDGGGRCTLEVADAAPEEVAVGTRLEPTFRRLYSAGGVHDYFWKARPLAERAGTGH